MIRRIGFLLCSLFPTILLGQFGCTDPFAQNYDASATHNDGSCNYAATNVVYPLVDTLAIELPESSGLEFWDQLLWSHNDSDNSSRFYGFDTLTGLISRSVLIENSPQIDWEDMTKDESHFYIGDVGNNAGTRTNLKILKISFDSLSGNTLDTVQAEFIHFSYPDQTDFSGVNTNHNFDCEALIFFNDSLHLFSKNRSNGYTKHYVLPTTPGTYVATFIDSVFVDGQITSAAFSSDSILLLIGYKPPAYSPFAFVAWDYHQNNLFSGKKGFISSEQVTALNQVSRYFSFDLNSLIVSTVGLNQDFSQSVNLYPNPFQETIFIKGLKLDELGEIRFVNALGVSLPFTLNQLDDETVELSTEQLSNGCYFLLKVERPEARSSEAPMRVKIWSSGPSTQRVAGTKAPMWASSAISAVCRM